MSVFNSCLYLCGVHERADVQVIFDVSIFMLNHSSSATLMICYFPVLTTDLMFSQQHSIIRLNSEMACIKASKKLRVHNSAC